MLSYAPSSSVMPFEGTSRASRAMSTLTQVTDDYSYSETFTDKIFLVFDELGRFSPPSSILIFIQFLISFYQYYITSFLPFLPKTWDFSQYPDKIIRYLNYPVDFGLGDREIYDTGIVSYFILILSFLVILYLIIIIFYFHVNKMFPHYHAFITRFVISFLIPIILPPLCYNIGFSFNLIFSEQTANSNSNPTYINNNFNEADINHKPLYVASTVLGIIFYLILIFIHFLDFTFRSSTPYLENTVFSMWDCRPVFMCLIGTNIAILFSRFIQRLPKWSYLFMNVCCIFYNGFILYQMFFFPMIKKWMNSILPILISSSIIGSLFQLFPISSIYRIIIPFVFLFVFIPVFIFLFRLLRKKIVSKELEEINLSKEKYVLRYLRLCISDKCDKFVSFNFLKPINQVSNTSILCQVAQMVSFFPSESQILTLYITFLSKKNDLSLSQRFLFIQLRRVHILRQSNTSRQLNEDLEHISKMTNQSISFFQQFLIRTIDDRQEITIDRLSFLSKVNRSTNSLCHEAISRYPNNPRLLLLFSQYVIECQADFKRGVQLFHEAQMIERGKYATIDFAFRSMANLFPVYLYRRILDSKGNIILNRKRSKSGSSMSVDSISNEKNISEIDFDSNDKVSSCVIDNPRLRLSLRKDVMNMNSIGITIISISSIFRFLFSIAICIVIYEFSSNFLTDRSINYKNIAQIGKVRKNVDLSFLKMAKLWAINLGISPKIETITSTLGPGITLNDYHNFTDGPKVSLFSDAMDSVKSIEKLGQLLIEIKYESSMNINDKTSTDFVQMHNISFCNRKKKSILQSSTSVRYFTLYLLNQAMQATYLDEIYDDPADWKDDESICEVILNNHNVINILSDQSTVLVNQERDLSTAVEKKIILFFSISIPIVFVLFLVPFIIGYVKLTLEFQQIFDILKLLPIDIYKKASQPIAIFAAEHEQSQVAVTQSESKSCQKIIIILPAIIGTIIVTGVLFAIFFLIKDSNSKFYSIVKWLEIGSGRSPLLIETMTNAIYSNIFGYLGDTDYTTLLYHLELVYNYSQELLYQHKALIWGSDNSVSCNNFSKRLDSLHYVNTCLINVKYEYFHHSYRCQSVDQQVMTFNKFAKDLYLSLLTAIYDVNSTSNTSSDKIYNEAFMNILNGYEMVNLHYLGIHYLLPRLEAAQEILDEGINMKIEQLKDYSLLISLLYLAVSLIIFFINLAIIKNLKDEYNIIRILIARLPPLSVVRNQQLVELITGNLSTKKDKKLTPIMINVRYCSNPIITFDKEMKIQLINKTVTEVFGYTKEQLFQADLSIIFSKENYSLIQQKVHENEESNEKKRKSKSSNENENDSLNEISESQLNNERISNLTYLLNNDDDIDLNSNDNNNNNEHECNENIDLYNNPFKTLTIGTKDDGVKLILSSLLTYLPNPDDSYVLILKDVTPIFINDDEIKKAKQKTIEIMNQVLPRALTQSGQLKENISFSIKLVSVICIKIINFNDSIPHITSVQAIRNMSELFANFDMQIINYPNLTKTSMISDSYMAVGGLFNPESIRKFSSNETEFQNELNQSQNTNDSNQNTEINNANIEMSKLIDVSSDENQSENSENEENNDININDNDNKSQINDEEKHEESHSENKNNNENINDDNDDAKNTVKINKTEDSKKVESKTNENIKKDENKAENVNTTSENANNDNENVNNNNLNVNNNSENINNNNLNANTNNLNVNTNNLNANNNNENINNNNLNVNNNNENVNNNNENVNNNNENVNNNNENVNNNNENVNNNNENINNNNLNVNNNNENINNNNLNVNNNNENAEINNRNTIENPFNSRSLDNPFSRGSITQINSRKSIYDIKSLNPKKYINFTNIILDSIYFAFDCMRVVDYFNSSNGTNFVLGIGITIGGPVTAGTIGKEHLQFELVGGTIKESYIVCNSADDGSIVITQETYECIKDNEEAQKNIIFEKYKNLKLLHLIRTDTFTVRPTENIIPPSQYEGYNNDNNNNNSDESIVLENEPDEQQIHPDDIISD